MEKKTTQRIIGMLVVIALVIILLPLLFSKNEMITQTAENKSQPLMNDSNEQTIQLSSNTTNDTAQATPALASDSTQVVSPTDPTQTQQQPQPQQEASALNSQNANNSVDISPSVAAAVNNSVAPVQGNNSFEISDPSLSAEAAPVQTDTVVSANTPAPANSPVATNNTTQEVAANTAPVDSAAATQQSNVTANDASTQKVDATVADANVKPAKKAKAKKEMAKKEKSAKSVTAKNDKSVKDVLSNLKKTAWVIQMGSFKDKTNATRLADKLRTAGFKAFTHEVTSAKTGKVSTRVYIGPEDQQASAQQLSSKVEQDLNLHGIVVSFKPLEL